LDQDIANLREKRANLEDKLNDLNSAIAAIEELIGTTGRAKTEPFKEQLSNAIYVALSNGPLHRRDILINVTKAGVQVGLKNPLSSLASYLSTDERFVNVGKGIWALADQTPKPTMKDAPRHTNITAKDLGGFTKLSDALAEIAMRNDGIVYCSEAAKLLVEAGVTQAATQASANAVIHRTLNQSDEWQKTKPGIFRYLPPSAQNSEDADCDPKDLEPENNPEIAQFDFQTPFHG
jgi:hypothetical protein